MSPTPSPLPDAPRPARESPPVVREFADPAPRRVAPAPPGARARWLGPLLPLAFLGAVGLGVALVLGGPGALTGWVGAAALVVGVGWVMTSVLWPARADRTCPECGRTALERADPDSTHGLVCGACGWTDESQSSWLLAEEEGPLEPMVMRQRGRLPRDAGSEMDKLSRGH